MIKILAANLFVLLASCSQPSTPGEPRLNPGSAPQTSNSSTPKLLRIFPPQLISGYNGAQTFKAPVISINASDVKWTIDDPSLASIASSGSEVMLTMLKAGKGTLTASSGSQKETIALTVNSYTAQQYADGKNRYETASGNSPACLSCHGTEAGPEAPNHTPTAIGADTDDQVGATFTTGKDPEGRPLEANNHVFTVTEAEKIGLVVYLRSLEPRGYPEVDPKPKAE